MSEKIDLNKSKSNGKFNGSIVVNGNEELEDLVDKKSFNVVIEETKSRFDSETRKKLKSAAGHIGLLVALMLYTLIGGLVMILFI